jgi:hypothetical protein
MLGEFCRRHWTLLSFYQLLLAGDFYYSDLRSEPNQFQGNKALCCSCGRSRRTQSLSCLDASALSPLLEITEPVTFHLLYVMVIPILATSSEGKPIYIAEMGNNLITKIRIIVLLCLLRKKLHSTTLLYGNDSLLEYLMKYHTVTVRSTSQILYTL